EVGECSGISVNTSLRPQSQRLDSTSAETQVRKLIDELDGKVPKFETLYKLKGLVENPNVTLSSETLIEALKVLSQSTRYGCYVHALLAVLQAILSRSKSEPVFETAYTQLASFTDSYNFTTEEV
ncbi:15164_t:CDS:1, partial [Acaulospora morrowiae]